MVVSQEVYTYNDFNIRLHLTLLQSIYVHNMQYLISLSSFCIVERTKNTEVYTINTG